MEIPKQKSFLFILLAVLSSTLAFKIKGTLKIDGFVHTSAYTGGFLVSEFTNRILYEPTDLAAFSGDKVPSGIYTTPEIP